MSPRDPSLPEGTDHIIDTNIDLGGNGGASGGGGTGSAPGSGGGGSTASGGESSGGKTGDTAFKFDKDDADTESIASGIVGQVKEQISTLKDQAGEKARTLADDGKGRATGLLKSVADVLADAAGSVEERFGGQYAGIGNRAADSIQSLASSLDERSVDDLLEDARAFVQRSPVIAIGIAAIVGFAVARVVRSSISEYRGGDDDAGTRGGAGNDRSA